jgi:hypothetical protein
MRNVSKTLAILAQMGQMWRIGKMPHFQNGARKWGKLRRNATFLETKRISNS